MIMINLIKQAPLGLLLAASIVPAFADTGASFWQPQRRLTTSSSWRSSRWLQARSQAGASLWRQRYSQWAWAWAPR